MGQDPRPTAQSRRVEREAARDAGVGLSPVRDSVAEAWAETEGGSVAIALAPFLIRDDGWLRIVPQNDGATVYFKWKWTAGPHRNCYVMTVYPQHQAAEGLARLAAKVDAVDCRKQAPVKDHYFKG